jgi:hypothetical protein
VANAFVQRRVAGGLFDKEHCTESTALNRVQARRVDGTRTPCSCCVSWRSAF